tara:strand:+ start:264 stop:635 length:372 start_codon:yes stop_codon:yes gene_type:complete
MKTVTKSKSFSDISPEVNEDLKGIIIINNCYSLEIKIKGETNQKAKTNAHYEVELLERQYDEGLTTFFYTKVFPLYRDVFVSANGLIQTIDKAKNHINLILIKNIQLGLLDDECKPSLRDRIV